MTTKTLTQDLAELNEGFIALAQDGLEVGLTPALRARVQQLRPERRRVLAGLPFALFGLGFEEEGAWATLLSPCVRDLEPGYANSRAPAERFTLLVLSILRSHVRHMPQAVCAWMGLPPQMRNRLLQLEISLLAPVAACAAPRLRARRVLREGTWLRLVDAAERDDARQLALLAAQGRQWSIRRSLGISATSRATRAFGR